MSQQMSYGLPRLTKEAVSLLQQIAPVSSTGQPTVVSRLAQSALPQMQQAQQMQQMQPQNQGLGALAGPSPQMQPQPPGTMDQAAQSAAIANQQQQAAQQQAMQQAMQMAQQGQQPQGMASGGIAKLPAHNMARMRYAQGGVIGFNGVERSDVPDADSQEARDRSAMVDTIKKMAAAGYDVATLLPRGLMGAAESAITRPLRAVGIPIPYLPEAVYGGDRSSMTPAMDALRRSEEVRAAEAKEFVGRPEGPTPQQIERGIVPAAASDMLPPMPKPGPTAPRPGAAPAAAQAAPRPAGGTDILSKIANMSAPNIAADIETARNAISNKPITEQEARIQQLLDMQNKLPPARQEELETLRDVQRRRLEARKKQTEEEGWDRFMAVFGGLGRGGLRGAGEADTAFTAQQRAQTAQQLAEDEAHAQKVGAIIEAQNNQKVNALKTAVDEYGKTLTAHSQFNTAVGNLASHLYSTQGTMTGAQVSALASIYSANVHAETQKLLRQTQAEANQLAKMETLMRANTHDYATVDKDITTQLEKKYGIYTALFQNPEKMQDPKNVEIYNRYLKDKTDMMRDRLDPIKANMQRIQSQINAFDFGAPPPGAVKPMKQGS